MPRPNYGQGISTLRPQSLFTISMAIVVISQRRTRTTRTLLCSANVTELSCFCIKSIHVFRRIIYLGIPVVCYTSVYSCSCACLSRPSYGTVDLDCVLLCSCIPVDTRKTLLKVAVLYSLKYPYKTYNHAFQVSSHHLTLGVSAYIISLHISLRNH